MTDCSSGGIFSVFSASFGGSCFSGSGCAACGCLSASGACACSGSCCLPPGRTMRKIAYTIADTTAQEITPRIVPSFPIYSSHTAPIA